MPGQTHGGLCKQPSTRSKTIYRDAKAKSHGLHHFKSATCTPLTKRGRGYLQCVKASQSSYYTRDDAIDQDLVQMAMAQGVSSDDLRHRLEFLAPLGLDAVKLKRLMSDYEQAHGGAVLPLLDPEKAQGLQELVSLLYELSFSCREVGEAVQALPQLADMSAGTMGMRVLRCKALGMDRAQIVRLVSMAPVVMMWEDEYFDQAIEYLKETRFHMPPSLLCGFMCHCYGGAWGRRHKPGPVATQYHISVMAALCSSLGISDPQVRSTAFNAWQQQVGEEAVRSTQPEAAAAEQPESSSSTSSGAVLSDELAEDALKKLKWIEESVTRRVKGQSSAAGSGNFIHQGGEITNQMEGARETDAEVKADIEHFTGEVVLDRVWDESLQLSNKQDADLMIQQLHKNIEAGRKYGDEWMVKAVQLHEWPTLLLSDPKEAYELLKAREGFAAFMA